MGHLGDFALVVADGDVGMMVFAVGNPRRCLDLGVSASERDDEYVSHLDLALLTVIRWLASARLPDGRHVIHVNSHARLR